MERRGSQRSTDASKFFMTEEGFRRGFTVFRGEVGLCRYIAERMTAIGLGDYRIEFADPEDQRSIVTGDPIPTDMMVRLLRKGEDDFSLYDQIRNEALYKRRHYLGKQVMSREDTRKVVIKYIDLRINGLVEG